jgi:hypothetical protein
MINWGITNVTWSKDILTGEDIIKSVTWTVKKDNNNSTTQNGTTILNQKILNNVLMDDNVLLTWVFEILGSERQTIENSL